MIDLSRGHYARSASGRQEGFRVYSRLSSRLGLGRDRHRAREALLGTARDPLEQGSISRPMLASLFLSRLLSASSTCRAL